MTQIAELKRARRVEMELLDATEFQSKGLRDAVELLEDLKGPGHTRQGLRPLPIGNERNSRSGIVDQEQNEVANSLPNESIPSPPALSSDSDDDGEAMAINDIVYNLRE